MLNCTLPCSISRHQKPYHYILKVTPNHHSSSRTTTTNHQAEVHEQEVSESDFWQVPKVDNHVHLAAAFHAEAFAKFIKTKAMEEGDTEVVEGKTLAQV